MHGIEYSCRIPTGYTSVTQCHAQKVFKLGLAHGKYAAKDLFKTRNFDPQRLLREGRDMGLR